MITKKLMKRSVGAINSSLWKIQSLQDHVLPQTCTAAKELVEKGLKEKELDVFALLEITSKRRRKCLPMFQ